MNIGLYYANMVVSMKGLESKMQAFNPSGMDDAL